MELTGNVQGLIDLVGGGSEVEVTQVVSSGTKIATITVDDTPTDLYAPEGGSEVEVTQVVGSGTKIATITVDDVPTDLYAPEGGSEVEVTQVVSSGTKIATITVDDVPTDLYAPEGGSEVEVTQVVSSGEKIATITVDDVPTDLYAPSGGGGVDPIIYSTTERKVGKWNNDDLYQKSYFFAVTSTELTRELDSAFSSYTPRTFDIGLYNESEKRAGRILSQYIYIYNSRGALWIEGSLQRISEINYAVVTVNYTK